ncbi:T9SS type A sorting domain-containing protein [Brumimicrobium sp.]|uniref:T9SS type A sorting domain-containing protein n=1 Tax=Brumimicrobium sp. TaxID=2029867 RepID=UPI003A90EBB2
MKKRLFNFKSLLLIIATGLLSMSTFAQMQIDNSDFEQWDDVGSTDEEPVNWNSFMTANCHLSWQCGIAQDQQIERTTDAHSGTYAARIWSRSVFGVVANGNMTIGRINMGSSTATDDSNFNYTNTTDPDFNQALTGKPDSLVVWVKYNPVQATSLARISATIHDNFNYRDPEDAVASPHKVAQAILNYGSTNNQWSRISIPFDYAGPATTPAFILITFTTSSIAGGGSANDEVFIDDLELIYNANEVEIAPIAVQNLFVNESGNVLTATETPNAASSVTARQWKSSTTAGGPYTAIAGETGTTYTPSFSTAGTYYVVCETDFDGDVVVSNEVQVIVDAYTASIAPVAVQNLIENQNGSILTVTENATADSRQWKYATTAGGPYIDITGETATTYTPLFPTAGTYYVVCESVLAGTNIISNEVQINVVEFTASITPAAVQNLVENQTGSTLTVTESQPADSRQWKYASTSGGPYTNDIAGQTATTYTPQFSTAGTYFVVCESSLAGSTVVSNEVEINVTTPTSNVVSIAPSLTQTLIENQSGIALTANEIPAAANSREWMYSTTSGSGYTSFAPSETAVNYTPMFANVGVYYVVCVSDFGNGDIVTSAEVVINVVEFTNSIDPSADQTIDQEESGNVLTVTETPAADAREWMFSTTSGSGYASFTTPETGSTYIPYFETPGTYYVVCESEIDGFTTLSNEVKITVESTAGVSDAELQTFSVYAVGQNIIVDLSDVEIKDASIQVLNAQGRVVAKEQLRSNVLNSVQLSVPQGIYFYSIHSGLNHYTGKVYIKN